MVLNCSKNYGIYGHVAHNKTIALLCIGSCISCALYCHIPYNMYKCQPASAAPLTSDGTC